jgi:6-phosphofructokinase
VPGANNVVDGLLRFQSCFPNVTLLRFKNGFESLIAGDCQEITRN